ncbi:MAG: type 1 glutamine amidotransferase domain-containing protein [Rickettsiales bacterium]
MNLFGNDNDIDNYAPAPTPERLQRPEKIAILTDDKTEDLEFFYPYYRLTEEGYHVDVITPEGKSFEAKHGLGLKKTKALADVDPREYALLYIPGGKAPASLRKNEAVLEFVRAYAIGDKPIAAICHGPQILASAEMLAGKDIAAWPEIRDEIAEAGATFVDEALVIDGAFITARRPGDLPRHLCGVLDVLQQRSSEHPSKTSRASAA